MTKENEGATEEDLEDLEDLPDIEEGEEDKTDWKAEAQKRQGMLKRAKTKIEKLKSEKKPDAGSEKKSEEKKSEGLDRIDRAVLRTEKITDADEIKLVESIMKETGKTVEQVLESRFFQSELKEMRDLKKTEDATPTGTKRSGTSTRDTVDYWIAKGELPPMSDPELRRKVVNAKMAKEKSVSQFSTNPIQ